MTELSAQDMIITGYCCFMFLFYIGISRGKDMSNILGVSDEEEKPSKIAKKRRPRLTELDDTEEDDDTDDYHVSL